METFVKLKIRIFGKPVSSSEMHEFRKYQSENNVFRILIISIFLVVEQFFYAFRVSNIPSLMKTVYIHSALLMALFVLFSILFMKTGLRDKIFAKQIFVQLFILSGMGIALYRFILIEVELGRIPTIYIAALYGIAVIFYLDYIQSLVCYAAVSVAALVLLPVYHPEIILSSYSADVISNGMIAFILISLNYRSFVRGFHHKKEIEAVNAVLVEQSIRDSLTAMYNRRKLDDVLKEVTGKTIRYNKEYSVILMDIDLFKNVNDSYGHDTGDKVLVEFAGLISTHIREVDVCGRWGGEEFLIICPETPLYSTEQLAQRLKTIIAEHRFCGKYQLTASFGIAAFSEAGTIQGILKSADVRLYYAKTHGRNMVVSQDS